MGNGGGLWLLLCVLPAVLVPTLAPEGHKVELRPYSSGGKVTFTDADGVAHPAGTWSDKLEFESWHKPQWGIRTQVQQLFDGPRLVIISTFDRATLLPLASDFRTSDGRSNRLEFKGLEVDQQGTATVGATLSHQRWRLAAQAFDFTGGIGALLLRQLVLRSGVKTSLPVLALDPHDVPEVAQIEVHPREAVRGTPAWRIEVKGTSVGTVTYWISEEPPYLLRMALGLNSGVVVFERE